MIDWYDRNQCHHGDVNLHDRSNGRIFKISYGQPKPVQVDLQKKSDLELANLQLDKNDWYVRQSRRILQERSAARKISPECRAALEKIAFRSRRVRGPVCGDCGPCTSPAAFRNNNSCRRCTTTARSCAAGRFNWPARTGQPTDKVLAALMNLSRGDDSPVVRLYIASALQRIAPEKRWDILVGLVSQSADNQDHNLPLMYWYAAEPLAAVDAPRALALAIEGNIPLVHEFMVRRIGVDRHSRIARICSSRALAAAQGAADAAARSCEASARPSSDAGRCRMPAGWPKIVANSSDESDHRGNSHARVFAVGEIRRSGRRSPECASCWPVRKRRSTSGRNIWPPCWPPRIKSWSPCCEGLFDERRAARRSDSRTGRLRRPADSRVPAGGVSPLNAAEKRDVLATLASRAGYAKALLEAVEEEGFRPTDLPADLVRQMRNLKNDEIDAQIVAVWGVVRDTPEDKAKLIAHYKQLVACACRPNPDDLPLGRAVFAKTCQQCHTLFGVGGKVGPELTGSNRADLNYLLSNVLDPSAVMAREYIPTVIVTTGGRVITGLVTKQTNNALTIVTANETVDHSPRRNRRAEAGRQVDDARRPAQAAVGRRGAGPDRLPGQPAANAAVWPRPRNLAAFLQRQGPGRLGRQPRIVARRERRNRRHEQRALPQRIPRQPDCCWAISGCRCR